MNGKPGGKLQSQVLRRAVSNGWFLLVGASLLATSPIPPRMVRLFIEVNGPVFRLTDASSKRRFVVRIEAIGPGPNGQDTTAPPLEGTLSTGLTHSPGGPAGRRSPPWVQVELRHGDETVMSRSFLERSLLSPEIEFSGGCSEASAAPANPCVASLEVKFDRAASSVARAEVQWSLSFSKVWASETDQGGQLPWVIEFAEQ
ncbi:MAG: hypothetical protein MJD61_10110 [Proteobacteria bacterium]|nr:hypothetical protein [Pseudomonadota bacterium]